MNNTILKITVVTSMVVAGTLAHPASADTVESRDRVEATSVLQALRLHQLKTEEVANSWRDLKEQFQYGAIAYFRDRFRFVKVSDSMFPGDTVLIQVKLYQEDSGRMVVFKQEGRLGRKRLSENECQTFIGRHEVLRENHANDEALPNRPERNGGTHFSVLLNDSAEESRVSLKRHTAESAHDRGSRMLWWWPWALAIVLLLSGMGVVARRILPGA